MSPLLLRLQRADRQLLEAVVTRRRPFLDAFMRTVTHLADWPVAATLALILASGVVPLLQPAGIRVCWTLAASHLLVEVLKRVFTRERPQLPVGLEWLVTVPDRFSFPSGHATAGMSLALPLALALPMPSAAIVAGLGICVGMSRCYLGVHYPGDILAGWALSVTVLTTGVLLGF